MVGGYANTLLEVNLTDEEVKRIELTPSLLEKYIGGRGLATRLLWDRLGDTWGAVDPLSAKNPLLMLTGPLTGFYPGGRICVSGKTPQSNGIVGSTVAGRFGIELKCAGYDGVIFTGQASQPTYLLIKDDHITFEDASDLWGKSGKETIRDVTKEAREKFQEHPRYGKWNAPSILYIGPAGEREVRIATIMAKLTHAAGYGGYGAVMGSKKLKAVAVKGTNPLPAVDDMEDLRTTVDAINQECYASERFRRWGTGDGGFEVGAKTSAEPIRNWQEEWHNRTEYGVNEFEKFWMKRYWADYGCPLSCMKLGVIREGPHKGSISDNPDYELQAYLGTNLGIFSPEDALHLSAMADDLGLCGIQGGNIFGFAAELYQRGILTEEDLDGIKLEWGNTDAFEELAKKIAERDGIGDILAEGTYRAARQLSERKGQDIMQFAIQSKGIGIGAHGIRSEEDYTSPISYACSTQGGDHTSIAQNEVIEGHRILYDSLVICNFLTYNSAIDHIWDALKAVTGWDISTKDLRRKALRVLHIQRAALLLGGPDVQWVNTDENPSRFYEKLPSGPYEGKKASKEEVEDMKREYFEEVGWDEHGIPTTDMLQELGLININRKLEELRRSLE